VIFLKKVKLLPVFLITISVVVLIIAQLAQAASVPIVSGSTDSKSIASGTKISVFNKMLEISYPKDNALIDDDGLLTEDQSVSFTVYLPEGGSPDEHAYTLVSNIYQISVEDDIYRLMYPGQISIAYNSNISPSVANQLSIWYSPDADVDGKASWDDSDNINLGGITNVSQHTVTAPFQLNGEEEGYYAVFLAQLLFEEFTDKADESAWSYPYVTPLWAKGIIERLPVNRDDDYFGLSTEVNRLEFATMLVKGLGLPLSEDDPQGIFSDVDEITDEPDDLDPSGYFFDVDADADDYYSDYAEDHYCIYDRGRRPVQYVETSARNGIVSGYPDRKFKPARKLTREEAAVIIGRAANLAVSDDMDKVRTELTKLFEDGADISPWAAPTVLAAAKAGLIKGETGSTGKTKVLNPGDPLTRAQAATLTYNLLKKLKKI
jgi:hypothetical protein